MTERISSSLARGFVACLPVAASVGAYGAVMGVLAQQHDISWPTLLLMNLLCFAGSAQFVMVDMWTSPLPLAAMALAVAAINLRYLLIGASLRPLFAGRSLWHKITHMHLVADENWAVTMAAQREGRADTGYLLGGGLCVQLFWSAGTLSGLLFGAAVRDPSAWALDFAFTAVFTALAVSLWRGKRDVLPWVAAGAVAIVAERLIPGKWYILIGALAGALGAAIQPDAARRGGEVRS
jgi:4-azaleucine resistance transporter AzlC